MKKSVLLERQQFNTKKNGDCRIQKQKRLQV